MPVEICVEDERCLVALFDICQDYYGEQTFNGHSNTRRQLPGLETSPRYVSCSGKKKNLELMVEGDPTKTVSYMIDALAPEQFQSTVRKEMVRESNQPFPKNVAALIG
ncbi:hypothetical protein JG688_00009723 [Phytophthora aleatoria]|uniref:Uncharacterized protein n=1 Tax=Phytophthora aleatoria TaxID=2496075 RepID=A0A8J5ITC2_9STRA|nr:hypothetical protein JG688_00009723 [Phytophthora aleatoria]